MIKEFIRAWEENKDKLEDYFRNTNQREYCEYSKIIKKIFEIVINPYLKENECDYPLHERI